MSKTTEDHKLRIGNQLCHDFRIARRNQYITIASHDQGWRAHGRKRLRRVKIDEGLELQIRCMKRSWSFELPLHLPLNLVGVCGKILWFVSYGPDAPRGVCEIESIEIVHDADDGRSSIDGPSTAAECRAEHKGHHPLGITAYQLLRDRPAHRIAKNIGARDLQMIQKAANILGHVGEFIPDCGFVAKTGAAIVEKYHCEPLRQRLNEVERPSARVETIAHDEYQGWPGATDIESDLDAVNLYVAHRHCSTTGGRSFTCNFSALSALCLSFIGRLPVREARTFGSSRSMSWAAGRRRGFLGP